MFELANIGMFENLQKQAHQNMGLVSGIHVFNDEAEPTVTDAQITKILDDLVKAPFIYNAIIKGTGHSALAALGRLHHQVSYYVLNKFLELFPGGLERPDLLWDAFRDCMNQAEIRLYNNGLIKPLADSFRFDAGPNPIPKIWEDLTKQSGEEDLWFLLEKREPKST